MPIGVVKWYSAIKGYGFIAPEGSQKDVFVHASAVEKSGLKTLNQGDRVSFEIDTNGKGKTSAVKLSAA